MMTVSKRDLPQCVSSFITLFQTPNAIDMIKEYSIKGTLSHYSLRHIAWKLFLNVHQSLSLSDWITNTIQTRQLYQAKIKEHIGKNTISSCFEDSSLKHIINLDISRTFQDIDIFRITNTKDILFKILLIWSKDNKDISYQQGMNDILAILLYAIYPYYFTNTTSSLSSDELLSYCQDNESIQLHSNELYLFLYDETALEADLYTLFNCLMKRGGRDLFNANPERMKVSSILRCLSRDENADKETVIAQRCLYVIDVKLRQIDNDLYYHLKNLDINGLLFLQRWIKGIFNREFPIDNVVLLWDAIFSKEDNNERYSLMFIDYISIAMLVHIRKKLINGDQSTCFDYLFTYPHLDAKTIIELAEKIKQLFIITIGKSDNEKNYLREQLNKIKENNTTGDKRIEDIQKKSIEEQKSTPITATANSNCDSNGNKKFSLTELFKKLNDSQVNNARKIQNGNTTADKLDNNEDTQLKYGIGLLK